MKKPLNSYPPALHNSLRRYGVQPYAKIPVEYIAPKRDGSLAKDRAGHLCKVWKEFLQCCRDTDASLHHSAWLLQDIEQKTGLLVEPCWESSVSRVITIYLSRGDRGLDSLPKAPLLNALKTEKPA